LTRRPDPDPASASRLVAQSGVKPPHSKSIADRMQVERLVPRRWFGRFCPRERAAYIGAQLQGSG